MIKEVLAYAGINYSEAHQTYYNFIFDANSDNATSLDELTMLLEKYDHPIQRNS
jgi:hypothetical protein